MPSPHSVRVHVPASVIALLLALVSSHIACAVPAQLKLEGEDAFIAFGHGGASPISLTKASDNTRVDLSGDLGVGDIVLSSTGRTLSDLIAKVDRLSTELEKLKTNITEGTATPSTLTYDLASSGMSLGELYNALPTACTSDLVIQLPAELTITNTVTLGGHPCDSRIVIRGTASGQVVARAAFVVNCNTVNTCVKIDPRPVVGGRGAVRGLKLQGFTIKRVPSATADDSHLVRVLHGPADVVLENMQLDGNTQQSAYALSVESQAVVAMTGSAVVQTNNGVQVVDQGTLASAGNTYTGNGLNPPDDGSSNLARLDTGGKLSFTGDTSTGFQRGIYAFNGGMASFPYTTLTGIGTDTSNAIGLECHTGSVIAGVLGTITNYRVGASAEKVCISNAETGSSLTTPVSASQSSCATVGVDESCQ